MYRWKLPKIYFFGCKQIIVKEQVVNKYPDGLIQQKIKPFRIILDKSVNY